LKPGPVIQAGLILSGLAAGVLLGVTGGMQPVAQARQQTAAAPVPVELNTVAPPPAARTPLDKPVSLESAFGRSELSGNRVTRVPPSPLWELGFDRRWDVVLEMKPPRPGADLPPEPAPDELQEPESGLADLKAEYEFSNLPPEAQTRALSGVKDLREGTALLKEGERSFRRDDREGMQGRQKMKDAAVLFRSAVEKFEFALRTAPQDRELLDLIQEAKANLYFCMKHGR
jgi:hypothetical protein